MILVGIASSTLGDNLGYLFGYKAGRKFIGHWRVILHITDRDLAGSEDLLRRHGSLAIFVARWIRVFRIMAGPLACIMGLTLKKWLL